MNPNAPTRKLKNMVRGIRGKINILAGRDTIDRIPVVYRSMGNTATVAAIVVATTSRKPNRIGRNRTQPITFGVKNNTPKVAINESWNDISLSTRGS